MTLKSVFHAVVRRVLICAVRVGLQCLLGTQADVYLAACEHYLRHRKKPTA